MEAVKGWMAECERLEYELSKARDDNAALERGRQRWQDKAETAETRLAAIRSDLHALADTVTGAEAELQDERWAHGARYVALKLRGILELWR